LCKTIGISDQIAGYMTQACSRRHMYGSSSGALDAREKAVSFAGKFDMHIANRGWKHARRMIEMGQVRRDTNGAVTR
jgi:hypothetical protein